MQLEQQEQFNQRLGKWIASQGFWFQLRHSIGSTGTKGSITYHLLRLGFRLLIFVALVAAGGLYYLLKRTDQAKFRSELRQGISESISVNQLAMRGAKRTQGYLEISRLASEGGPDTFFETIEIRNLKCRMGLLDGLTGVWEPGPITIHRLEMQLRAGTDTSEYSAQIGEIIFRDYDTIKVENIEVATANIGWGYSERTRGRIEGASMSLLREGENWRVTLRGGTFAQNWLRNLNLDELVILCTPEGITFEKALLARGQSTVDFTGLRVSAGDRPEVRGVAKVRNLDLENILPSSALSFVEGRISSDFTIAGSTNTVDGVSFDGVIHVDSVNTITVRDRIHLLRALSVVDFHNSYRRLDFTQGSVRITTKGGSLMVRDINLAADDLATMTGEFVARPPTPEELDIMLARGDQGSGSNDLAFEDETDEKFLLNVDELERQFTLRQAANAARRAQEATGTQDEGQIFERIGMNYEARMFAERQASRMARMLIYEGEVGLSVLANAFDRTETLRSQYPVNPDTGRIHFTVPLAGPLYELTLRESDAIYEMGRR